MIILQLIFNGIVAGTMLALVAAGFNLIFYTTKVFHLAHGAVYTLSLFTFSFSLGYFARGLTGWLAAIVITMLVVVAAAITIEKLVYWPLMRKNAGQVITLISSLGVYFLIVNLIALVFGNESILQDPGLGPAIKLKQVLLMPIQVIQLITGVAIIAILCLSTKSSWYLKVRALAGNRQIAAIVGINEKKLRISVIVIGSFLAAISGVLRLFDTGTDPQGGMTITLSAVAAVIVGGKSSLTGCVFAAFLIAFLQTFGEWWLSSTWKESITFLLLIGVIMWRTDGIIAHKMRVEEK